MNQLKAGVVLSYLSLVLNIIIGLLYTPIMLRMMGQSEYGLYSLTASVVGYLTILDLGFGSAIVRYTAKYKALNKKEDEYNLNGMFLVLYTLMGVVAAIIGTILYFNVENMFSAAMSAAEIERAKVMMVLLVFNLSISFPLSIFGSIITAYEKYVFSKMLSIGSIILNPCIMLPLLFWGYRAIAMILVITLLNVCCLLSNLWYCFAKLKIKILFKKIDVSLLKEIFNYSFFVFLSIIVEKINWSAGQFILGAVAGTVVVAIYAVALQISGLYITFSTAISSIFFPRITTMVAKNAADKELSELFIKIGRIQYIAVAFVLSGFLIFGQEFIKFWAGENYGSAFYMAIIIMIPVTIPIIQNVGISILQAKNRIRFRSVTYILIAFVNLGISIPLSKIYGGIGCAIGTAAALAIGHIIIMNIYYYKRIHIDIPRFWREIVFMTRPVLIAFVCGVGSNYFIPVSSLIVFIIKGTIFAVSYALSMWFIGMNQYEKDLFMGPIKKCGKLLNGRFNGMIHITDKYNCSGCFACVNKCPKDCISMIEDQEGFLYPQVDKQLCNDCGLCQKVCPMINNRPAKTRSDVYACKNKNEKIRLASSSGGVFTLLAEQVLNRKGVVFGAMFNSDFKVVHGYVQNKEELYKLRGSKYVQSLIGNTYKEAEKFLKQDKVVLFSGTPCQARGLKSYLQREYTNLIIVDLICHGVPSPKVFRNYVAVVRNLNKDEINNISFRDKSRGWKLFSFSIAFRKKSYSKSLVDDLYMKGFLQNMYLRPSCYKCRFKDFKSGSDITIADYWGIHTKIPEFDDDKGVSLVIVATDNGRKIFEQISPEMEMLQSELEHAVQYNPFSIHSALSHPKREQFFAELDRIDFQRLMEKYCDDGIYKKIELKCRAIVRKTINLLSG